MSKLENPKILEFGAGASTVWLAKRTNQLISIEHNPKFYRLTKQLLQRHGLVQNVDFRLLARSYAKVCAEFNEASMDMILIDGRDRAQCLEASISILKSGGLLVLDNAERQRYQEAMALVADWNHTISQQNQPDDHGFKYPNWQTHWWIKP
ncbi:MAG: class I SAM-dependent methyltransferase [Simkaniaceae bacterium]|nr:class I SAM-dependent methyltransferase [Simkaniaceae bacterium]